MALALGTAHAQSGYRVPGPEGVWLTIGPIGQSPTEDSVTAQLNEALVNYDNSAITIREGIIAPGEEFATRALPYEGAARLGNDITRSGALGGQVVLLPAGAAVYADDFANANALFFNGQTRVRNLWCGANGDAGHCVIRRGGGWEVAEIRTYSPYSPMTLGPFVPSNDPILIDDPAALAELPERAESYRFTRMRGGRASIARALRIGDALIEVDDITVDQMLLGSILVRFERGAEPGSVLVRTARIDPAEYQTEMRRSARAILGGRR